MSSLTIGEVAALGGEVNRVRVVAVVPDVRIGAAIEQRLHHRFVAHAEMQRRSQAGVPGQRPAFVDDGRMLVEDRGNGGGVASGGGGEQRRSAALRAVCRRRSPFLRAIQLSWPRSRASAC